MKSLVQSTCVTNVWLTRCQILNFKDPIIGRCYSLASVSLLNMSFLKDNCTDKENLDQIPNW